MRLPLIFRSSIFCVVLFTVTLLFTGNMRAEEKRVQTLPLLSFIERVTNNDPYFRKILIDELYLQYAEDLELPISDLVLKATANYSLFLDQADTSRDGKTEGALSLSKLFPSTGTTVSASYTASHYSTDGQGMIGSAINARLSQEIVKNAFGRTTRKKRKRIHLDSELTRLKIVEAYENYLASLIVLYIDWHSAMANLDTSNESVRSSENLLSIIRKKRQFKVAHPEEVAKIQMELESAREQHLILESKYTSTTQKILNLTGFSEAVTIIPSLPEPENSDSRNIDFDRSFAGSRTYKIVKLMEQRGILSSEIAEDDLLPSVSLFANYKIDGIEYQVRQPDRQLQIGISSSYSFGNQVANAVSESAKLDKQKNKVSIESNILTLKTDLATLKNSLQASIKLIEIANRKVKLTEQILRAERYNYSIGKATINELILARKNMIQAKYNLVERHVFHASLRTEWQRLTDTLVDRSVIHSR